MKYAYTIHISLSTRWDWQFYTNTEHRSWQSWVACMGFVHLVLSRSTW